MSKLNKTLALMLAIMLIVSCVGSQVFAAAEQTVAYAGDAQYANAGELEDEDDVDVNLNDNKQIMSINLAALPVKLEYLQGEELDMTGAVVKAINKDYTSYAVTTYQISGYNANTVGEQTITITYKNFTTSFVVLVYAIGDVDSNGAVDGNDATLLLQYAAGWDVTIQEKAADVNGDYVVDGNDATLLLQYAAGWDVTLGNQGPKVINKNVRFVGHSIWWYDGNTLASTGVGGGETARGYQTLLKERYTFNETTNYCYSGFSLAAKNDEDTNSIMGKKAKNWTGTEGDIWTLDTITNDFKRNIPIGTIDDYNNATGITTYYGALRAFADKVVELSGSNAIVICANALKRNEGGYTSTSANTQGHTLRDYENAIKAVAAVNGWIFVDQYNCEITDQNVMMYTVDGLHLNNAGYLLAVKPWYVVFDNLAAN